MSWIKRTEAVIDILKGSSISEIELVEGGVEILIRRNPGALVAVQTPHAHSDSNHHLEISASAPRLLAIKEMKAPLTGIYYASPSPEAAPFINIGDTVTVGQTIALIEAMKVFNEIPSEVAGRIVAIKAASGNVVKKGDVLFQVETQ
jgi:acetyl-CoA carboxylase biotin carboxyl carrier protein